MDTVAIGIDIGGTKTAIGIVNENGRVIASATLPTNLGIPPRQMVRRIAFTTNEMLAKNKTEPGQIKGIGIGAPGPLDPYNGMILRPPNLPNWENFPLSKELQQYFSCPVQLENDATAAALAEKWIGAARDCEHFVFVTISTGIGGGLYSHGRLITGASGNAGDIGHMVIDPSQGTCACGQDGCWEHIASGTAIARRASELCGENISAKEAVARAQEGDQAMARLLEETFRYIGMGCVNIINTMDPEKIVIGGGVAQIGEMMFSSVREYVARFALNPAGRKTAIVPAMLQQNAGLIGAAALVHMNYK